jgi:hypothetical protein
MKTIELPAKDFTLNNEPLVEVNLSFEECNLWINRLNQPNRLKNARYSEPSLTQIRVNKGVNNTQSFLTSSG